MQGPLTRLESEMVVADFMYSGVRGWNWEAISFDLPQGIKDKIRAIPCQQAGRAKDIIIWKFSKDGNFSTKSAYDLANLEQEQNPSFQGQWIWKLDMLPKIVNFLWLIIHNSMPVRDVLASRGIDCERKCPLCKNHNESIIHVLRECVFARDFWHKIRAPVALIGSFNNDLLDWLRVNCLSRVTHHSNTPWSYIFLLPCGVSRSIETG